jgi:uncharacterized protein (DUF4415 family)
MAAKRKVNPELIDDENPEWTAADFKRARPAGEVLSPEFLAKWKKGGHTTKHVSDAEHEARKRKRGERGKQVAPTKQLVSLRLSADVLAHFRATGPGWQTRIDEMLKREVKRKGTSATLPKTSSRSRKPAKSGRQAVA